jgi:hypothetical protein
MVLAACGRVAEIAGQQDQVNEPHNRGSFA